VFASLRLLAKSAALPHETKSRQKWLKQFLGVMTAFQLIWLIYLVPYVMPVWSDRLLNAFNWYPVYVPLTALIYWLGIKGLLVTLQQRQVLKDNLSATAELPRETVAHVEKNLLWAMNHDRLYLDPQLNVARVSTHTGIPQKHISAVLNQHLHQSFNEFVNGYRVEAFKQMITEEDTAHLTLAGVAAQCGFNSQATFQRSFKEITGVSPSAFRKGVVSAGA
jgi:AraC-like DNA-binding protein